MGEKTRISCRAALPADLEALVEIEAESFRDAWNASMLLNELANPLAVYLVLEEEGRVIGYAGFWLAAGEAQVTRVAVLENKRAKGYGNLLAAALVKKAWDMGAGAVTLEVREGNTVAQKVYASLGFKSAGVRPHYYPDNQENAVIMWLYSKGAENV